SGADSPRWLAAGLAGALALAAVLGARRGVAAEAVAAVALCGIVFLLSRIRNLRRCMIASSPTPAERRHMLRSRRLSAQLRNLRSAADSLHEAVVLIDPAGHARWFNRAAGRLLGLVRPRDRGVSLAAH